MNKKTNTKPALKKQHFEILLEDVQDKFNVITEAVSSLNTKIDTKTDALADAIKQNREETIFLIKASIESSEQRLTKKIEDGDRAVVEQLTKKIEDGDRAVVEQLTKKIEDGDRAVVEQLTKKIEDGDKAVVEQLTKKIEDGDNAVVEKLTKKIDEVKDIIKIHTDTLEDHGDRISNIERKLG